MEVHATHRCVTTKVNGRCPGKIYECNKDAKNVNCHDGDECKRCDDPMVNDIGQKCIDNRKTTQAACEAASGVWMKTTSNSNDCANSPLLQEYMYCTGGKNVFGNSHYRKKVECEKCGGVVSQHHSFTWSSNSFLRPSMVTGKRVWKKRELKSIGKVVTRVEEWQVRSLLEQVRYSRETDAESAQMQCLYGKGTADLLKIAAICGKGGISQAAEGGTTGEDGGISAEEAKKILEADEKVAEKEVVAGEETTVGSGDDISVKIEKTTVQEGSGTVKIVIEEANLERTSKTVSTDKSMYAASCFSYVKNSNDKVVGQLIGACALVKNEGDGQIVNDFEINLKLDSQIKHNEQDYSEWDVVKRTGESGAYVYTPQDASLPSNLNSTTSAHVTFNTRMLDTYFCPARRVAGWAAKTADVGEEGCAALATVTATLETKMDEQKQFCDTCGGCCDQLVSRKSLPTTDGSGGSSPTPSGEAEDLLSSGPQSLLSPFATLFAILLWTLA